MKKNLVTIVGLLLTVQFLGAGSCGDSAPASSPASAGMVGQHQINHLQYNDSQLARSVPTNPEWSVVEAILVGSMVKGVTTVAGPWALTWASISGKAVGGMQGLAIASLALGADSLTGGGLLKMATSGLGYVAERASYVASFLPWSANWVRSTNFVNNWTPEAADNLANAVWDRTLAQPTASISAFGKNGYNSRFGK